MSKVDLFLLKVGHCDAYEHHAIRDGKRKKITFDAIVGLIRHPKRGVILFDTGYSERFYTETNRFPECIYSQLTKVHINEQEDTVHQLKMLGIEANEVRHIIVSHFHADHIGGLKDFPNATFYCSQTAYQQLKATKSRLRGVSRGILKGLLPEDFDNRIYLIEQCLKVEFPFFEEAYDLFGDGLIQLVDLSGHAAGQIGVLLKTEEKDVFLVADACWLSRSYQQEILPNSIVRLFFDSWDDYKATLRQLHDYHKSFPDVLIIPTHCNSTTNQVISSQKK